MNRGGRGTEPAEMEAQSDAWREQLVNDWRRVERAVHPTTDPRGRPCDPNLLRYHIVRLLVAAKLLHPTARQVAADAKKLRAAAEALRRQQTEAYRLVVFGELGPVDSPHLLERGLSDQLEEVARNLDSVRPIAGRRRMERVADAKTTLTRYIHSATGKWNDRLVAEIIRAALLDPDYSEEAHKAWRNRNKVRLNVETNEDRWFKSRAKDPVFQSWVEGGFSMTSSQRIPFAVNFALGGSSGRRTYPGMRTLKVRRPTTKRRGGRQK